MPHIFAADEHRSNRLDGIAHHGGDGVFGYFEAADDGIGWANDAIASCQMKRFVVERELNIAL